MLPPLLQPLDALTRLHPLARKQLLGPDLNWGRDLLAALAHHTGGWVGWEAVTLKSIALELATVALHEAGLRLANDIELTAHADAALADCVTAGSVRPAFKTLAHGQGFRIAVRDTVLALRIAGVTPLTARTRSARAHDVAAVLDAYERRLDAARLADPARLFALALAHFDDEAPYAVAPVLIIAPALVARGLPGRLLARMLERVHETPESWQGRGAHGAATQAIPMHWRGASSPTLFHAATPDDELREALRRALAEGYRLDQVELVTTDPDSYGLALDALAQQAGIGATSLHGVPFARTRLGRALYRWLAWLRDDLPADSLRAALEAGEYAAGREADEHAAAPEAGEDALPAHIDGVALSRLLRQLPLGNGREGMERAIAALEGSELEPRNGSRIGELLEPRLKSRLGELLGALLRSAPSRDEGVTVSALARAVTAWLELAARGGHAELRAVERLTQRLDALAELEPEPLPLGEAIARVGTALADLRAWTSSPEHGHPWSPAPGRVHLTDLAHAGTTGRPRLFVLGLDAERTAGARLGDPILDDDARRAIDEAALPTVASRSADRDAALAHALAALPAHATLSWASTADRTGREVGPAPVVLATYRAAHDTPAAGYDDLRTALGAPASAVPTALALDARDAWLGALVHEGRFHDGAALVRHAFAGLDAGLAGAEARAAARLTPHQGLVLDAAGALDPRTTKRAISPTSLEQLATCPLAWFYRRGLEIAPPEEPADDPGTWLDLLQRGSLLHTVFERFATAWMKAQDRIGTDEAKASLDDIVTATLDEWRTELPPPSAAVFAAEAAEIRRSAHAFREMEIAAMRRPDAGRWHRVEYEFGGADGPVLPLADGAPLRIRGRIDRIDRLPDGRLVVIDYKTGGAGAHRKDPKRGPFNGGRSLQTLVYALAAEHALRATVARFEYRFPSVKGNAARVVYARDEMTRAAGIIERVLAHPAAGHFPPTLDASDCTYCDYAPICRVRPKEHGGDPDSPRAAWAKRSVEVVPELHVLRDLRRREGSDGDD